MDTNCPKKIVHGKAKEQLRTHVDGLIRNARCCYVEGFRPEPETEPFLEPFEGAILDPDSIKKIGGLLGLDLRDTRGLYHLIERAIDNARREERWLADTEGEHRVGDLASPECIAGLQNDLYDFLISLPHEYETLIPFRGFTLADEEPPVYISSALKIFKMTEEMSKLAYAGAKKAVKRQGLVSRAHHFWDDVLGEAGLRELYPPPNISYLSITTRGYGERSLWYSSSNLVLRDYKVAIAALCALEIVEQSEDPFYSEGSTAPDTPDRCYVFLRSQHDHPGHFWLPMPDWEFVSSLWVDPSTLMPSTEIEKVRLKKAGISSLEARHKRLQDKTVPIGKLFPEDSRINENAADIKPIRTALQWLYDGMANYNKTFSFVQFMVALEALLDYPKGTKDLEDRLAERCSLVIGEGRTEQTDIKRDLVEAYKVRSRIVHQGELSLNEADESCYNKLRRYLFKALSMELNKI